MQTSAKITSEGQITIPLKVRTALGVKAGDKLVFEQNGDEMTVRPQKRESRFAKYAGIGNPGIGKGREAVIHYVRSLRDAE